MKTGRWLKGIGAVSQLRTGGGRSFNSNTTNRRSISSSARSLATTTISKPESLIIIINNNNHSSSNNNNNGNNGCNISTKLNHPPFHSVDNLQQPRRGFMSTSAIPTTTTTTIIMPTGMPTISMPMQLVATIPRRCFFSAPNNMLLMSKKKKKQQQQQQLMQQQAKDMINHRDNNNNNNTTTTTTADGEEASVDSSSYDNDDSSSSSDVVNLPHQGLYVIATPIGNMEDITLRALKILKTADCIVCEDTRVTSKLLARYKDFLSLETTATTGEEQGSTTTAADPSSSSASAQAQRRGGVTLMSYNEDNIANPRSSDGQVNRNKIRQALQRIRNGERVCVVSDAGSPVVSDPGANIVEEAHKEGLPVYCVPGPSSVTGALSVSGFTGDRFVFEGFLPNKSGKRRAVLTELSQSCGDRTMVFFESPHRIIDSLGDCIEVFGGDREAVLCRELTKKFEQIFRGKLSTLKRLVEQNPRGEFTIVIKGLDKKQHKKEMKNKNKKKQEDEEEEEQEEEEEI